MVNKTTISYKVYRCYKVRTRSVKVNQQKIDLSFILPKRMSKTSLSKLSISKLTFGQNPSSRFDRRGSTVVWPIVPMFSKWPSRPLITWLNVKNSQILKILNYIMTWEVHIRVIVVSSLLLLTGTEKVTYFNHYLLSPFSVLHFS